MDQSEPKPSGRQKHELVDKVNSENYSNTLKKLD